MHANSSLHVTLAQQLELRRRQGNLRALRDVSKTQPLHDFSSNDYLDLSSSSDLRTLFMQNIHNEGFLASTGSRLLSGNNKLAQKIEREAKSYWSCADTLLCASGYEANVSIFGTIPQTEDLIIYDELIHASVHVGMKSSRAKRKVMLRHNDMYHLRSLLRCEAETAHTGNVFLALETVYSMDGDTALLKEALDIIREEHPSTRLILDEAHATGVFGDRGQGLAQSLGLSSAPEILIRLHTLGKGAAGTGAIIICDPLIKQYLLNYAKGLIYSTYMSIPALCLAKASLTLLAQGYTKSAHARLWQRIRYMQGLLDNLAVTQLLDLPERISSPIVPIICTRAVELSIHLEERGFRVMPVRYPTVARGKERLRICLRADITEPAMDRLIQLIASWVTDQSADPREAFTEGCHKSTKDASAKL